MLSNSTDLFVSLILTAAGSGIGLQLGSHLGSFLDSQALAQAGVQRMSYSYWDIRLGIVGAVVGLILGAIWGYFVASRKN